MTLSELLALSAKTLKAQTRSLPPRKPQFICPDCGNEGVNYRDVTHVKGCSREAAVVTLAEMLALSKTAKTQGRSLPLLQDEPKVQRSFKYLEEVRAELWSIFYVMNGGERRFTRVDKIVGFDEWSCEPDNRQRLDHYIGKNYSPGPNEDEDGWDEDGWEDEYARPLRQAVMNVLNRVYPNKYEVVDVGEKGHIIIGLRGQP